MIPATFVLPSLRLAAEMSSSTLRKGLIWQFCHDVESRQLYVVGTDDHDVVRILSEETRLCQSIYLCARESETHGYPIETVVSFSGGLTNNDTELFFSWIDALYRNVAMGYRLDPDIAWRIVPARVGLLLSGQAGDFEALYFVHESLSPMQAAVLLWESINSQQVDLELDAAGYHETIQ